METKTCKKCGEAKRMCEFYKERAKCKACISEEQKERYLSNPELRERKKSNSATRYQRIKGSDAIKAQQSKASARYRERHPDRLAAAYERDKTKNSERLRRWRKEKPEIVSAQSLRRRPKQLAYYKRQAECITDSYIVNSLHVPKELAPMKRLHLELKRGVREIESALKATTTKE